MASDSIGGRWFVLGLNDMRSSSVGRVRPVVRAREAEDLRQLLASERVEPYLDEDAGAMWNKTFRRGGPLEWKNGLALVGGIVEVFVVTDAPLEAQILTAEQAGHIPTIEQATADATRIATILAAEAEQ
jgi:hypothetical protein